MCWTGSAERSRASCQTLSVYDVVKRLRTDSPCSRELFHARRASMPRETSRRRELCPLSIRESSSSALDRGERRPTRARQRVETHHTGCFRRHRAARVRRSRPDGAVDLFLRPPSGAFQNRWRRHVLDTRRALASAQRTERLFALRLRTHTGRRPSPRSGHGARDAGARRWANTLYEAGKLWLRNINCYLHTLNSENYV